MFGLVQIVCLLFASTHFLMHTRLVYWIESGSDHNIALMKAWISDWRGKSKDVEIIEGTPIFFSVSQIKNIKFQKVQTFFVD